MRRNPPSGNGSLCQRHSRNGGCVHPAPPGGTPVPFAATESSFDVDSPPADLRPQVVMVRPQVPPVLPLLHHLVDPAAVHDDEIVEELLEAPLRVSSEMHAQSLGGVPHEDDETVEPPIAEGVS